MKKHPFNFKGISPTELYVGKLVKLQKFWRDDNLDDPNWHYKNSYTDGPYKVTDIIKKDNNKWQIKLIDTKEYYGIHGKKPIYLKTRITVNENGVSSVMSCSSQKKFYSRTVIYGNVELFG
jgi:hypothetical protein